MTELKTFEFSGGLSLRVLMIEGEPWFVATDACIALGLTLWGGSTRHLTNLNQTEVARWKPTTGRKGGRPNAIISESGLYKLIMRSDKPEARKFQGWVTREVLPAIRKTGGYLLNEEARVLALASSQELMW